MVLRVWTQATEREELPFTGKERGAGACVREKRSSIWDILIFQHAYYKLKCQVKHMAVCISSLYESCRPEIWIWESSADSKYLNPRVWLSMRVGRIRKASEDWTLENPIFGGQEEQQAPLKGLRWSCHWPLTCEETRECAVLETHGRNCFKQEYNRSC